jgi:hypothetical protein
MLESRWQFSNCKFKFECNWQGLQFLYFLGFVILAVVTVKSTVFWNVMLCSPIEVHWYFRRICCLHLQRLRIVVLAACLLGLDPLLWRQCIPLKCQISMDYTVSDPGSWYVFNMSTCQICAKFLLDIVSRVRGWKRILMYRVLLKCKCK